MPRCRAMGRIFVNWKLGDRPLKRFLLAFAVLIGVGGQASAQQIVSPVRTVTCSNEFLRSLAGSGQWDCDPVSIASDVSGLGTGVATFLGTPSSANLRAALTDEVGTGAAYFVGGALSTPASGTLSSCTGYPTAQLTGAGTGVLTALAVNVGSAGVVVTFNG